MITIISVVSNTYFMLTMFYTYNAIRISLYISINGYRLDIEKLNYHLFFK